MKKKTLFQIFLCTGQQKALGARIQDTESVSPNFFSTHFNGSETHFIEWFRTETSETDKAKRKFYFWFLSPGVAVASVSRSALTGNWLPSPPLTHPLI